MTTKFVSGNELSYIIYNGNYGNRDFFVLKLTDFGIHVSSGQPKSIRWGNDSSPGPLRYYDIAHFKRGSIDYIIFSFDMKSLKITRSNNGTLGTYGELKDLLSQDGCKTPSIVQDVMGNDVLIWGNSNSPYNVYAAGLLWQSDGWPIVVDFPVKKDKPESVREYPSFRRNHLLYWLAGKS